MPLTRLGDLPVADFLRDVWQQRPHLARGALPDWSSPLTANELAGLACEDPVESRLVWEQRDGRPWQVESGPFSEQTLAQLPESGWSLLIQAVDQWVPAVAALRERFQFLPQWRLDDVMVSVAPPGGSVGPHYDQYDVFLLQVEGSRRWSIGGHCDANTPVRDDSPLRILRDFDAEDSWLLEPGDMLYLPPGVAHWGVAESFSLTYSIGFRAPSWAELLAAAAEAIGEQLDDGARYRDPAMPVGNGDDDPARIPPHVITTVQARLRALLDDPQALARAFGREVTAPKYPELHGQDPELAHVWLNDPRAPLVASPASRLAYHPRGDVADLFADGEHFVIATDYARQLCAGAPLTMAQLAPYLDRQAHRDCLATLLANGSLIADDP